jgi:hypothetical protein
MHTVQENEFMLLTRRDRIAFVGSLLNAQLPNTPLQEAVERHAQTLLDPVRFGSPVSEVEPPDKKHDKS